MALAYFIKSLENFQFGVYNGAPGEYNLTKGQTWENCVPFFSFECTGNETIWARTAPYFNFASGPKLKVNRGNIYGTQWVNCDVVEFDSAYVTVQQGQFQHSKQDTYTEKAQLVGDVIADTPVDPNKTFIIWSGQGTDGEDDWDHHNCTYYIMGDNQEIRFQRSFDESFGSNLKGYWYAVEASDWWMWDVHHSDEIEITTSDYNVYYDVPQDAPWVRSQSNTMIIASFRGGQNEGVSSDRSTLKFELIGSGSNLQLKVSRPVASTTASMYARVQLVTSPYFNIQNGEIDFAYDGTEDTDTISTIDTSTSIIRGSLNGAYSPCDWNAGGNEAQAFTKWTIVDSTTIKGETLAPGDTPGEGKTAPYQVISFEGDSPGIGTTTTTTTTTTSTFPYLDFVVPDEDIATPYQFTEYFEEDTYWTPGTGMNYSFYDWGWDSYTLDQQPSDWTRRDTYGEGSGEDPPHFWVRSKATPEGYTDRTLEIRSGNAWLMGCTPDDPGTLLDTETVALLTQNTTNNNGGALLHARLQGAPQYRTFYKAELYNTNKFRIQKWVGGTPYFIAEITKSYSVDTWYWVKFQVSGTNPVALKAKFWEYGTSEPGWDIDTTDSAANRIQTAGYHGPSDYSNAGFGPSPYTDTNVAYYSVSEDLSGGQYYYVSGSDGYLDIAGSWADGYRPTKIRLTGTHDVAGTWSVELHDQSDNTIATVVFPESGSEQTVEADITWQGSGSSFDIKELYLASATDGQIANIEFYEPFAGWSKEGIVEDEHYPGLDNGIWYNLPNDEDGIYGIDGEIEWLGFEQPDFAGVATGVRLAVRGKNGMNDGVDAEIWNGSTKLGNANISSFGHFYSGKRSSWIPVFGKPASYFTDLKVKLTAVGSDVHTWISELQIEFSGDESISGLVKSVEYIELTIPNGQYTASANLTKGQVLANCVPFTSRMTDVSNFNVDLHGCDVFFESGPDRVTAELWSWLTNGTHTVGVFVVEFNSEKANVQSGLYYEVVHPGLSDTISITPVSALEDSFVYIPGRPLYETSANSPYDISSAAYWLSDTSTISWQRNGQFADDVQFHWYVVEALEGDFTVEHTNLSIANAQASNTKTITEVDLTKAFVIASYRTSVTTNTTNGAVGIYLNTATELKAERAGTTTAIDDIRVQVIELQGGEYVQRGSVVFGTSDSLKTSPLAYKAGEYAIVHQPMFASRAKSDGGTAVEAYDRLKSIVKFVDDENISAEKSGSGYNSEVWYEIIDFEGQGDPWEGTTTSTTTTTTTTTTPLVGWVEFFDNTYWSNKSNFTWDGDSWVATTDGKLQPIGGWNVGLRPTYYRLTYTGITGTIYNKLANSSEDFTISYSNAYTSGDVLPCDFSHGQDIGTLYVWGFAAQTIDITPATIEFWFGPGDPPEITTTTSSSTTTTTTTTTTTSTTLPDWNPDLTFDYEVDVQVDVPSDSLLEQKVGFSVEGEMRPMGWKWDEMIWSKDQHRHDVVLPTLFDPDISTIPQDSWQSGIGHNLDLKIWEVIEDPGLGHPWRPLIRPGHYFIGPENFYLFSPNNVTRFGSSDTQSGLSKIDLHYMPKQGVPLLVAFMHRDDDGAVRDIDHFRKRTRFTGKTVTTVDSNGNLVSRQEAVHLDADGNVVNYNIKNLPTNPEQRGLEYVLITRPETYRKEYLSISVGKGEATLVSFNLDYIPVDGPSVDFSNDDIFQVYVEDQVPVNEGEYTIGYKGSATITEGQVQVVTSDRDQLPGYVTYWSDFPATILFNDYYVRRIGFSEWGDAPAGYNPTEPGIEFVETADFLGESSAQPNQVFYLSYFPMVDFDSLQVFVYDTRNEVVTEWTRIDDIESADPDDEVFTVSPDGGFILFGNGIYGKIPHIHAYIAACYDYVPYVQYMPDEDWKLIEPQEVNLQPLFNSTHRGFVYLSHKELSVDSLLLQTNRSRVPDRADTYGPINAGNDYALLTVTAFDKDGGAVPEVDISWKLSPSMGYINGASPLYTRVSTTTDSSGKSRVVYTPVRTAGDMGTTVYLFDGLGNPLDNIKSTYMANDTLELSEFVEADVEDIFVFMVLDDDPLQPYDPYTRSGGRRVVLYRYDEDEGDYVLVKPSSVVNKDNLVFDYALPTPTDYPSLVQYDIITDRVIEAKATTVNPVTGLLIESNPIKFYLNIPESQKGVYTLPTSTDKTASTLDSAVYLTIDRFGEVNFIFNAQDSVDPAWSFTTTSTTTTTTTTAAAGLFMLPDGDVSGTMTTFGSGTGRWDRLNSGIDSGTPDDSNGIIGIDENYRLSFTSPSFPGTCTGIIVRYRAKNDSGSDGVAATLYSDGASSDGESDIETPPASFTNYEHQFTVAKTAAQLTNLEVKLTSYSGANDDYFSELEVEIVL